MAEEQDKLKAELAEAKVKLAVLDSMTPEQKKIFDEIAGQAAAGNWFLVPVAYEQDKHGKWKTRDIPGRLLGGFTDHTATFMHADGSMTTVGRRQVDPPKAQVKTAEGGKKLVSHTRAGKVPLPIAEEFKPCDSPK